MQRRGPVIDDTKPVWRTMLAFLIPLMLSNILQAASGTFTSIYLGRLIGVGALAAASSVFPLVFFLISFFFGISSGGTVLIGQAFGARDELRLRRVAGTALTFSFVLGAVIAIVGVAIERPVLAWLGTPHDIFADAVAYAQISFATLPVIFLYFAYTSFLRGTGDVRTPFVILIVTVLVAVALAPVAIAGLFGFPALGVVGAPAANAFAYFFGIVWLLVWLERAKNPLALRSLWPHLGIDWTLLRTLVRIGIPTGVQFVMSSLAEIAVISFVNAFGSRATAAYGAVNQVASYVQFPAVTIGIASSIFGAQSIGARRIDRLVHVVRAAVTLNYIITGLLVILAYLLSREIISLFVTDQATIAIAQSLLHITLWSYVIFGNTAVLGGIMRSSGVVIWPTLISVATIWLVEVPCAWFFSRGPLGLEGVWVAYPITFVVALGLQSFYYFTFWRKRPIVAIRIEERDEGKVTA